MYKPNYKKGDVAFEGDIHLPEGFVCHATVIHGDPMNLHNGLRRLERVSGYRWAYEGYTADQIEADLAMQGLDTAATE